jgi:hypothetical protein
VPKLRHQTDSRRNRIGISILVFHFVAVLHAWSQSDVHYNRDVLPILAEACFKCHGFDKAQREAGLRLDSHAGATAKLESGARAVVPGKPAESALIERIFTAGADDLMPPKKTGKPLTAGQKDILKRWIEQGAVYEPHWAYIKPQPVEPPVIANASHPVDRFILARLAKAGVQPSPAADRVTLIRRVSLDLTGLPPSPLEVDAFVNDARADAYERVVERLLASEHFGERWARWWLDLAHYADSDGYLQDFIRPAAWRYRQWVVDAFNRDLPFDQFTIEQLAGDLLAGERMKVDGGRMRGSATTTNFDDSPLIATGFLRNTLSNREGGADLEEYRVRQVIDRTATMGTTWMALTVACAECHDHKFDAVSQREFYQLYAFFNNADEVNLNAPLPGELEPWELAMREHDRKRAGLLAPVKSALDGLQADWEKRLLEVETNPEADFAWQRALEVLGLIWGQSLGEGQLEGINIIKTPLAQRTQEQRDRLQDYFLGHAPKEYTAKLKELKAGDLAGKLNALKKEVPLISRAPVMMKAVQPRATHIHLRGEFRRHGGEVTAGTPAVLPAFAAGPNADRLALARWLVSPQHPLTARVTVNRLWQELFGRGMVATSENFGVRGDRPSHPELLDWLALEFQQRQWSIKEMLRLIVTSQTYRQSSNARPELAVIDPNNTLLARQVRLRLSAEMVRDAALAVSGLLSRTVGGPSVKPPQPESVSKEGFANTWEISTGADRYRRGLYTFIQRTSPFAQFVTFDLPDTSRSCSRRERSNTPIQALQLLNDPVFMEAARGLAARVLREKRGTAGERLDHAFLLVLGRPPTPAESGRLLSYLQDQSAVPAAESASWVKLCSVLLNLDEFVNRE